MENNNKYLVRVGLHASRQKFGGQQIEGLRPFISEGIQLNHSENKALFAILKLMDLTKYKGNLEGRNLNGSENTFDFKGFLPQLKFSATEYLESYGLKRSTSSRGYLEFNSNEREEALKALYSLSDKKFKLGYERKYFVGNQQKTDIVVSETNLIKIMWGLLGLSNEEKRQFDEGNFSKEEIIKKSMIGIELCPILVDQIDSYFILLPNTFYEDIKQQFPHGKYSQYIPLFIEWLIVQGEILRRAKTGWTLEINFKKLAAKLRMDQEIMNRKWKLIRKVLNECYEVAQNLGYILEYQTMDGKKESKEVIHLNSSKYNGGEK